MSSRSQNHRLLHSTRTCDLSHCVQVTSRSLICRGYLIRPSDWSRYGLIWPLARNKPLRRYSRATLGAPNVVLLDPPTTLSMGNPRPKIPPIFPHDDENEPPKTPGQISDDDHDGGDGPEREGADDFLVRKEGGVKYSAGACGKARDVVLFETCKPFGAKHCGRQVQGTRRLLLEARSTSGEILPRRAIWYAK